MPSKNNILTEKLNHALAINNNLRKQIEELSDQNKQLSITKNILLVDKLSLQTENDTIRNSNVQLTEMHNIMNKKISALEQIIQSCIVPALATITQWIPPVLESIAQMSKFEIKNINKENKEKQTNIVGPMFKGKPIKTNVVVELSRCDDMLPSIQSPITEQPQHSTRQLRRSTRQLQRSTRQPLRSTEQTPKRPRKLSYGRSYQCEHNMAPQEVLDNISAMLKSLKAVPNKEGSRRQLNENLGEGSSSLFAPENQTQNSNNSTNAIQNVQSSPRSTAVNEVQFDVTTIASTSSGITYNTFDGTEERHSDEIAELYSNFENQIDSRMMRNVTCRKRTRRSSESSSDDSTSS